MDKFISIGVGQGDAFFLDREGTKILVDGGKAKSGFPKQFERTVGIDEVDVVVCTHADADHVNGLIGYFDAGLRSKEVWLPGKWTSRLKSLLMEPENFTRELVKQINSLEVSEETKFEDLSNGEMLQGIESDNIDINSSESEFEQLYQAIEEASSGERYLVPFSIFYEELWLLHFPMERYQLLLAAIDTAKKIRELAIAAYHSGAKIRWFEYQGSGKPTGGEQYLRPVNSSEIFQVSKGMGALLYLSVSRSNKESLVYFSPGKGMDNGVIFSADSDFSFSQQLPMPNVGSIITSPHHGSEHNRMAYNRLQNEGCITSKTVLVRSDGKFSQRPGKSYKSGNIKKICTLCRHPDASRQDVVFTSSGKGWRKKNGLAWCHCR